MVDAMVETVERASARLTYSSTTLATSVRSARIWESTRICGGEPMRSTSVVHDALLPSRPDRHGCPSARSDHQPLERNHARGRQAFSAYPSSKTALTRLTEHLAADAREYGVSVFAITPGLV